MKYTVYVFTFLVFSIIIGVNNPVYANKDKLPNSSTQLNDPNGLNEAKAYRMLYDNQVKSNDAILKTIFYALGGLATAIVLVFASNWWFNEKKVVDMRNGINAQINEAKNAALNEVAMRMSAFAAEKTALLNELQIKLQGEMSASIADLTAKNSEFHEKVRAEIKEDNKSLLNNYQTQLESFNKSYRQEVSTLSDNIKNQIDNVNNKIKSTEEKLRNLISKRIDMVSRNVARNEFYTWKFRGIMENALSAQVEELELLLKHPDEDRDYDTYLEQISETLGELSQIDSSSKEEAINVIKEVPDRYNNSKNELLNKLEKIKTVKG